MKFLVQSEDREEHIQLSDLKDLKIQVKSKDEFLMIYNNQHYNGKILKLDAINNKVSIEFDSEIFTFSIKGKLEQLMDKMGMDDLEDETQKSVLAPMPGLIIDINIEEGQTVDKGEKLAILEAMKMENILKSESSGTVKSIHVEQGQTVEKNQILIEFD